MNPDLEDIYTGELCPLCSEPLTFWMGALCDYCSFQDAEDLKLEAHRGN